MAFTEFCCKSGGSNLNSGTLIGDSTEPGTSPTYTYASGNWVQSTRVFTVASGNPASDGVAVGQFASVYADGSTTTGYVGRISNVTSTTITIDSTAISGTAPTDGTGNRTLRIGGAWAGPSGAVAFPFGVINENLVNSSGHPTRVNFKNDTTYLPTSAMTHSVHGTTFEGYSATYGDGNRAIIDGGSTAILLLTVSGSNNTFKYLDFTNNAASGTPTHMVNVTGNKASFIRCLFRDCRNDGLHVGNSGNGFALVFECEAYNCNTANTANRGGIRVNGNGALVIRSIVHHCNQIGFAATSSVQGATFVNCIAAENAGIGFFVENSTQRVINCDAYANTSDGIQFNCTTGRTGHILIENCNAIDNGGWGIQITGAASNHVYIFNCGFGSGTMANTSGTYSVDATDPLVVAGNVTYAANVTPWIDPDNGNFQITLDAAKNAGRGTFLITDTGNYSATTTGYTDIGAAQHLADGGIVPSQVQVS